MIKKLGWLLIGLVAFFAGCGGGSNVASNGVGSGGTGSYTSGPVSGLGSIIVNGIRYDVESAAVADDEDSVGFDRSGLKLGMFVEVQGSTITAGSGTQVDTATATSVKVSRDFIGRVWSVTTTGSVITSINVLGRPIAVDSKTVFSAAITTGDYVAVYGLVSATGYTATRIEKLASQPVLYKASGVVRNLNTSLKQFDLGVHTFSYDGVASVPAGLRNGALVRVWWLPALPLTSPIQLFKLKKPASAVSDSTAARFRGLIGELTDQQHFVVNGVAVDASALNLTGLVEGSRLVIRGRMVNGVLVASQVTEETPTDVVNGDIELHGFATGVSSTSLTVRGVTVTYTTAVSGGVPVAENQCIEVRGKTYDSNNQLVATDITPDSGCLP